MKKIKLLILCFSFISCWNKTTQSQQEEFNFEKTQEMNTVLKSQLEKGISGLYNNSFDIETYNYSNSDLEITIPLIREILLKRGYQPPTEKIFIEQVQKVFHRIINPSLNTKFLYLRFDIPCDKEIKFYTNDKVDNTPYSYYIVKNENFLTELYALPELLDYKKLFPDLYKLETSMPSKIKEEKTGDMIQLTKWQEVEDLDSRRKENIDKLVHRNKYLFNDNRSSFRWICLNDEFFLTSLVLTFGYVEDKELNKYVLEKQLRGEISQFGKVFWYQGCDGKLFSHNQMIDIIKQSPIEKQKEYLKAISSYIRFLVNDKNLPFSQKAEILGKLCYYAEKIGKPIDMGFKYFYILETESSGDIYEEEFKKKEYYNIPDFKKVWEYTRTIIPHSKNNDIIFSKKVDINKDGIEDGIIVYNPENDLFATIKIVLSDKDREKLFFNTKMLSNNITSEEGFRNISFKGHFFTIEENVSSDLLKYTTFFVDSKTNNIFLYKLEYSNISDDGYDDEYYDSIYLQKKNGKVSFENYDPKTLKLF